MKFGHFEGAPTTVLGGLTPITIVAIVATYKLWENFLHGFPPQNPGSKPSATEAPKLIEGWASQGPRKMKPSAESLNANSPLRIPHNWVICGIDSVFPEPLSLWI